MKAPLIQGFPGQIKSTQNVLVEKLVASELYPSLSRGCHATEHQHTAFKTFPVET